jgi:hypothetical protein
MKVQDVAGNTIRLKQEMGNRSDVYGVAVRVAGLGVGPNDPQDRFMMVIYHWQDESPIMESVFNCKDRAECVEQFKNWVRADKVEEAG